MSKQFIHVPLDTKHPDNALNIPARTESGSGSGSVQAHQAKQRTMRRRRYVAAVQGRQIATRPDLPEERSWLRG